MSEDEDQDVRRMSEYFEKKYVREKYSFLTIN